ncbi:hypothetical protein C5167_047945 [Papaver somniferum]|uniref:MYND-type domain-containing protein n=1 Tax=Papaver somniferum TaxID=3469 RepID=A0A4Y7KKP5_PAPSO|nr:programmed cell death protein 2-like isoform X2 [Papaver somniferum]RZC72465.1 hypothetical protein C5167_047945 [Papaver somniferum]
MVAITSEETEIEVLQCSVENTTSLQDSDGDYDQEEEEEEEEEDDEEEIPVTLGFVEQPKNPNSLLPQFFPSKAGGTPAWLDPVDLPSEKSRNCGICGDPLQFLLQVYAPISGKESTFHRTLFVFMCTSMTCLLQDQHQQWKRRPEKQCRSVKVFRCQLPRSNAYYSSEPPKLDKASRSPRVGALLCNWCGTWKGDKVCSGCRNARYCSEAHQKVHWLKGHKKDHQQMNISSQFSESSTSNGKTTSNQVVTRKFLWTEFEISHEDEAEYEYDTEVSENDYSSSLVVPKKKDEAVEAMMGDFEGDDDRRSWTSFQVRVGKAPEQVLRYTQDSKAKPLWPMASGRPSKVDIPKCNYCFGPLCFEMQILPQLLYFLRVKNDVDSLDWATIAVYTCVDSCETSVAYKEEFAWVQLNSQTTTPP